MKKILIFFIILGITIGLLNGVRNKTMEQNENIGDVEQENTVVNNSIMTLAISDVDTLNPLRTKRLHLSNVLKLVYEPLFSYDEQNQLEPVLVEQWMKRDELTWIIRLRDDVIWHNGEDFTADDVKYTIDLLINNEIDSIYKSNVTNISSVESMDEKTIVLTLIEADSYLLSKLTFPIISKNYFIGQDLNNETKSNILMGTGPYKYITENEFEIKLMYNEDWWKKESVKLKNVNLKKYSTYSEAIKGFKSSEIDMIITNMYDWKENFGFIGINSYQYENTEYEVLIPNTENKIFADNSVRKALLYGINRANIVSTIYDDNAVISDLPFMSNSKYKETSVEYNTEIAKQILMNGGWSQENNKWKKENTTLKFTLLVCDEEIEKIAVAEKIKSDLNEIGIQVTIKEVKWDELIKSLDTNKFELILMSLDIKNEYQIQNMVQIGNTHNYANFINVELNEIVEELEKSEGDVYEEKMKDFKEKYINELPYIGLYFKTDAVLTNKSVKGEYKSTVYEPYRNLINFYK